MNRRTCIHATLSLLALAGAAAAGGWGRNPPLLPSSELGGMVCGTSNEYRAVYTDLLKDASLRRTDPSQTAPLPAVVPDLLEVAVGGWSTPTPATDPFTGDWAVGATADLLCINIVIQGLVNPPGTISPFLPTRFGDRPFIGFFEFDADATVDTGGECDTYRSRTRYLANAARFGARPGGSLGARAARNRHDFDDNFATAPQHERSGADFLVSFCGCFSASVVTTNGDSTPGAFGAGDTWVIRGRFFQRIGGYNTEASAIFGGTAPGAFDPQINVRFKHDQQTDRTSIRLVFPLTMAGAAAMANQPVQQPDTSITNHTSVYEALLDIVDSVDFTDPLDACEWELIRLWAPQHIAMAMDPSRWVARAVVGVPYLTSQSTPYAYTDVGFDEVVGDLNGNRRIDAEDRSLFVAWLGENDGGVHDDDGQPNGTFVVQQWGPNFQLHDFDNDGLVDASDADSLVIPTTCPGDVNGDNMVNFVDANMVFANYGQGGASHPSDLNHDGIVDFADLNVVFANFGNSCR